MVVLKSDAVNSNSNQFKVLMLENMGIKWNTNDPCDIICKNRWSKRPYHGLHQSNNRGLNGEYTFHRIK